ncbi:MAG: hypothetical protein IJA79_00835, partial [Desulfovibrio sp.]|nr:hypothetical protein [Desulfovibrio sp.]
SLLSRNQNLKDFFFPLAIHLSMNDPLARCAFSVARCRFMHPFLQTVKNFFQLLFRCLAPSLNCSSRSRERATYTHTTPPVNQKFPFPEKKTKNPRQSGTFSPASPDADTPWT